MSNPELDPFVEANACSTCPSNQFATTSNNDDLSCCAAIRVTDGTCTACTSADTSGCTAVSCIAGKGNADNDATTGCEVSCAAVVDGTCTSCTSLDASGCTAVTCDTYKFDTNGDATDGCEAGCTAFGGTCTTCTTALTSGCTAVTCSANKFDTNNNAADGCEAGCADVTDGTCDTCNTAFASGCTAVSCQLGTVNFDNDATTGCELTCATVADSSGRTCDAAGAGGVQTVTCNTGFVSFVVVVFFQENFFLIHLKLFVFPATLYFQHESGAAGTNLRCTACVNQGSGCTTSTANTCSSIATTKTICTAAASGYYLDGGVAIVCAAVDSSARTCDAAGAGGVQTVTCNMGFVSFVAVCCFTFYKILQDLFF